MKTYVLYHGGCWDGFCAAWIARKKLGNENVEYIAVNYGQSTPNMDCGSCVYLLDFSYKRPAMRDLLSQMHQVVVLDHHKTAEAELAGLVDEFIQRPDLINNIPGSQLPLIWFDMAKSGGRLAWEYFFGRDLAEKYTPESCEELRPWLVDYTEDRDLWRWSLPMSREVNAALRSHPLDFELWDKFDHFKKEVALPTFFSEGAAILRREKQIIEQHIRHAREFEMAGHRILAVNATVLHSEIAGELAKDRPFGACYFDRGDGMRVWSLRSTHEGVDVSTVAKNYGGGGHRNAAGYEILI
jgi:oligoribonuclease NrnB/cAMP/cGMP phosphodiesterase (DHH superfamily)